MRIRNPLLASALLAAFTAIPVLAADTADKPAAPLREGDDACLQNNRLWSWNVVNGRTLSITDRTNKTFTVRLASGCVGLTNLIPGIEIRGIGSLSCVRRGDFVRFVEPTLGRMSCAITAVERVPEKPAQPVKDQIN
jgi:hypothetical protein